MWISKKKARTDLYYSIAVTAAITATTAAAAMYLLDPRTGRRRRALLRDQMNRAARQSCDFVAKTGRDARQRARGLYETSVARLRSDTSDDAKLTQRIRSELGRVSAHPRAISVTCTEGIARLTGDILEGELASVLACVTGVRGIQDVVNEMRIHNDAGSLPALQGEGSARRTPRSEYLQENWSPAPRALAGAAGAALLLGGLGRRSPAGLGLATLGAALLGRSISNTPWTHLLGLRTQTQDGLLVQKTVHVYADLDETYSCWRKLENFPAFMSHVREVSKIDDAHYHWKVDGPAGVPVEWDAVITADVPGELIAWRTVADSAVQSSGVVQFEPSSYGGTRVHVRMVYRPPANVVGHTVAKIFGRDPKRQIDADLVRFKSYIETGRTARDAAAAQIRH